MGQSLIRTKTANANDFTAVFTLQLIIGILVYAAFFLLAPSIALFFENPLYTDLVRVSAVSFLLRPFYLMRATWLTREMNFKSQSLIDMIIGLVIGILTSAMAWCGFGVWSLVASGLVGGVLKNIWLAFVTPIKAQINLDFETMRKHSNYGFMIVANDFLFYLRKEGKSLVINKLAGPAFLGLFNKAESLARLPNDLLTSSILQPLFRAMSKAQDDLVLVSQMLYRVITLLMIYTVPVYVLLWWIATPFISFVYGEKWIGAAEPMRILILIGFFQNIIQPCALVLATQNRLKLDMIAQSINLPITLAACAIGLSWGFQGVAVGIVISQCLMAISLYYYAHRILQSRIGNIFHAIIPGLTLGCLMFIVLEITNFIFLLIRRPDITVDILFDPELSIKLFINFDHLFNSLTSGNTYLNIAENSLAYLLTMSIIGASAYFVNFLLVPISIVNLEANRWRQQLKIFFYKVLPHKPRF